MTYVMKNCHSDYPAKMRKLVRELRDVRENETRIKREIFELRDWLKFPSKVVIDDAEVELVGSEVVIRDVNVVP